MSCFQKVHSPLFLLVLTLLLTAGCAGPASPPTRFFLLTSLPVQEEAVKPVANRQQGLVVELEPVEIPQYLNRPEMVTRAGGNRLRLERLNQWAGDFKEDIGRVTMENLSRLLGSDRVVILPNRAESAPHFRIATTINRFEPDEAGQVSLDARWTLFDGKGGVLLTRHTRVTALADKAEDHESLVGAMSKTLGMLNREMGEAILAQSGKGKEK
ncbi:MAG: membrane integrity-associated transporter subunit PqiC [Magnetococcales bacterium]|nr:membrane integrity-associated transporter subunit PqiC [Magnetococcales bacterium]